MSFGVGIGDCAVVAKICFRLYRTCKDTRSDFHTATTELHSLHFALSEIQTDIASPADEPELQEMLTASYEILTELEELLRKYRNMRSGVRGVVKKVLWLKEPLEGIRGAIRMQVAAMGVFLQARQRANLRQIQERLDWLIAEIREGKRPATILLSQHGATMSIHSRAHSSRAPRSIRSYGVARGAGENGDTNDVDDPSNDYEDEEEEEEDWKSVVAELECDGVTAQQLEANKDIVQKMIQETIAALPGDEYEQIMSRASSAVQNSVWSNGSTMSESKGDSEDADDGKRRNSESTGLTTPLMESAAVSAVGSLFYSAWEGGYQDMQWALNEDYDDDDTKEKSWRRGEQESEPAISLHPLSVREYTGKRYGGLPYGWAAVWDTSLNQFYYYSRITGTGGWSFPKHESEAESTQLVAEATSTTSSPPSTTHHLILTRQLSHHLRNHPTFTLDLDLLFLRSLPQYIITLSKDRIYDADYSPSTVLKVYKETYHTYELRWYEHIHSRVINLQYKLEHVHAPRADCSQTVASSVTEIVEESLQEQRRLWEALVKVKIVNYENMRVLERESVPEKQLVNALKVVGAGASVVEVNGTNMENEMEKKKVAVTQLKRRIFSPYRRLASKHEFAPIEGLVAEAERVMGDREEDEEERVAGTQLDPKCRDYCFGVGYGLTMKEGLAAEAEKLKDDKVRKPVRFDQTVNVREYWG
ncbi:hypothetical protein EX30DRAFT_366285 [Ascodesmis nigricans]|uniref:WW domain-containing protein n=1 Tax=Ascodesmis nigricans TaxID=341454 RepID=A0A4S2MLW8_9PEZI|nr:hypothetical protein EX30DRAFT_366285 [Ascodesmis nigricans]